MNPPFAAPTFEVPILLKRQLNEEYGLCALIGRDNVPRPLTQDLEDFSRWASDIVRLDR
jgi:hypothetical protein